MIFEYDKNKSKINKQKHNIDFEKAKKIWNQSNVVLRAKVIDEIRFMIIGKIEKNLYSCIFTIRNQKVRIISCRPSKKSEKEYYHAFIK